MRVLLRLAMVVAIVGTTVGVGANPAVAAPDTCAGDGTIRTAPLFWPASGPSAAGHFIGSFDFLGCTVDPGAHGNTFSGVFTSNPVGNYCPWGTGVGSFAHHAFRFTWSGFTIVFEGGVVGTLYVWPNMLAGESCFTGADEFLFWGQLDLV